MVQPSNIHIENDFLLCVSCGESGVPIIAPAGAHLKASCAKCGKYIKFISQGGESMLYFGKYRGKTIAEVVKTDPAYLHWLLEQPGIKTKIKETIHKMLTPDGGV